MTTAQIDRLLSSCAGFCGYMALGFWVAYTISLWKWQWDSDTIFLHISILFAVIASARHYLTRK